MGRRRGRRHGGSSTRRPARRSRRCRRAPRPTSTARSRPRRRPGPSGEGDAGGRAELLLNLADVIDEHTEELAEIESRNVGKPLGAARDEMPVCSDNIRFFAGAARILEGRSAGEYMQGYTSIRREPIGIVGQVAPWNYPLMMAVWKFAPALAAGNVSILKPSEQTPLSTLRLAELAADVIPPGVLNVITGDGEPVGAGIVRHPDVRMVSLTGDVATAGREGCVRDAEARPPRARRQGAGRRVRRRGSSPGRRGDQGRRLLELRAGLHGSLTRDGRPAYLRQAARGARSRRRVHERRRTRPTATRSRWGL